MIWCQLFPKGRIRPADQEDSINQATYTDRDERLRIDTGKALRAPFAIDLLQELLDLLLKRP